MLLAQQAGVGNPTLNAAVVGFVVVLSLVVAVRSARGRRAAGPGRAVDFHNGGSVLDGARNGVALLGGHVSAAMVLGVAGAVAVSGQDGLLFAVGAFVAWLVALLLVGERVRNTGGSTIGDVLAYRMRRRPVRAASATATVLVSLIYLVAQIAGAGGLAALLLGVRGGDRAGQSIVIAAVGVIVVVHVLVGGMRGVTWVQILKSNLLVVAAVALAAWVAGRFNFNFSALLGAAAGHGPQAGEQLIGRTELSKLDLVSFGLAVVLGPVSLPHVLTRFYTVPDAREARRSTVWAIWLTGGLFLLVPVIGYAAAALVGPDAILAAPGSSNSAVPLLAQRLGGGVLMAVVAAVAFASILAVGAGLTMAASSSVAHDVHVNVLRRGRAGAAEEVRVARGTAVVVGLLATGGAILANGQNIAVLTSLAFAMAAAANLPALVYSLFWRRFNTTGMLYSMNGGMALTVLLVVFSPAVSGTPTSMLHSVDFALFPLVNPGIVAIPAAFVLGAIGTWMGPRDEFARQRFAEMEVRSLTGAGTDVPRTPAAGTPVAAAASPAGHGLRPAHRPTTDTV